MTDFPHRRRDLFFQSNVHDPNRRRENSKLTYWKNTGGENVVYKWNGCAVVKSATTIGEIGIEFSLKQVVKWLYQVCTPSKLVFMVPKNFLAQSFVTFLSKVVQQCVALLVKILNEIIILIINSMNFHKNKKNPLALLYQSSEKLTTFRDWSHHTSTPPRADGRHCTVRISLRFYCYQSALLLIVVCS